MRRVMVRYRVKADKAEENVAYVMKVFEELHAQQPDGLRYATFRLDDGVSFIHFASIETDDGTNPSPRLTRSRSSRRRSRIAVKRDQRQLIFTPSARTERSGISPAMGERR